MKAWKYLSVLILTTGMASIALGDSSSLYLSYQYGDDADSGIGLGLQYGWELDPAFRVDTRVSFVQFTDIDLDMIPLEATAAVNFGDADVIPYVGVGVGYYLLEADRGTVDDDVGFRLLAGVDWPATERLNWFAEASWLWLEADVDQEFAATEGTKNTIELDGIGINLGVRCRF